jgi:iron complex transport system substrate-binding protein
MGNGVDGSSPSWCDVLPSGAGLKRLWMVIFFLSSYILSSYPPQAALAEPFTYTDDLGRKVTVSVPVKRAAIFLTHELIPALGLWDQVVGIGRYAYSCDVIRATKPDVEQTVASAGSGADVNIEVLLKLKPDVVVAWTYKPDTVWFMEAKGLKVIGINPKSLEEFYDVMRLHGKLFGKEAQVEKCFAEMNKVFDLVKEKVSVIPPAKRRRVLWLLGKPTTVSCGQGVTSDLLRMAGVVNPASGIPQSTADFSMEQIVSWNPDVIFIWGHAGYSAQSILESSQWRYVKAVREGNVYKAHLWSSWSPRIAPTLLWIASKTYPEAFRDVDVNGVYDDFYRNLYGVSYLRVAEFEK